MSPLADGKVAGECQGPTSAGSTRQQGKHSASQHTSEQLTWHRHVTHEGLSISMLKRSTCRGHSDVPRSSSRTRWAWTILKAGIIPHFTEAFCVGQCVPWAVFTVGAEHLSEGVVEAQRDQSCSELGVFASSKHQECRVVSQTTCGWVTVARARGAVEAPRLTTAKAASITIAAEGRDEGPVASCHGKPWNRPQSSTT